MRLWLRKYSLDLSTKEIFIQCLNLCLLSARRLTKVDLQISSTSELSTELFQRILIVLIHSK